MSNVKFEFKQPYNHVEVLDAETGNPLMNVMAFHLISTSHGMEARLIVEEPLLEGECTVPVTEQLGISDEFISLLAKKVARELQKGEEDEERFQQAMKHFNAVEALRHEIAIEVADSVKRSLLRELRTSGGRS